MKSFLKTVLNKGSKRLENCEIIYLGANNEICQTSSEVDINEGFRSKLIYIKLLEVETKWLQQ